MTDDKLAAFLADLEAKATAATPEPWHHVRGPVAYAGDEEYDFLVSGTVPQPWNDFDANIIADNKLYHPERVSRENISYFASLSPEVVRALVAVAKWALPCTPCDCLAPEEVRCPHDELFAAVLELRRIAEAR